MSRPRPNAYKMHDRQAKLLKRRGRMKLNGRSLQRLLNERAAKAQALGTQKGPHPK